MKYRDSMTPEELAQFDKKWQALDDAYAAAAAHDAAQLRPIDDEDYEDPSDYVGMGWLNSKGFA